MKKILLLPFLILSIFRLLHDPVSYFTKATSLSFGGEYQFGERFYSEF